MVSRWRRAARQLPQITFMIPVATSSGRLLGHVRTVNYLSNCITNIENLKQTTTWPRRNIVKDKQFVNFYSDK